MPRSDSHTREAPPQVTHHALPLSDQLLHSPGGLPESSYRRMKHFGNLGETRRASRTLMHTPRDPRRGRGEGEAHRFGEPRKPRAFTFIPASCRALHPGEVALVFAQSMFGHGLVYVSLKRSCEVNIKVGKLDTKSHPERYRLARNGRMS